MALCNLCLSKLSWRYKHGTIIQLKKAWTSWQIFPKHFDERKCLFFLDRWAIWLLWWLPAIVFVLYCICISLYYLLEITLLLLPQPPPHWRRKRGHNITWDHFYEHESSLNQARINNYIHYIVCGEVTYPFPNFNGAAGPSYSVGWNYLSIPKLQRCSRWSLVMDK